MVLIGGNTFNGFQKKKKKKKRLDRVPKASHVQRSRARGPFDLADKIRDGDRRFVGGRSGPSLPPIKTLLKPY